MKHDSRQQQPRHDRDLTLEWWMVELGIKNRAFYRRVRALAWDLVTANHSSFKPNECS